MWKGRNGQHYLGISVLWITQDWRMLSAALAIKAFSVNHTAANIVEVTIGVLEDFGIQPVCFVADNASNQVRANDLLADWTNELSSTSLSHLSFLD